MASRYRSFSWLVGGLLLAAGVGCGAGRGDLAGTVSYEGKPLRSGSVSVLGSDGLTKGALIQSDGTYRVQDIAGGPAKVAVLSPDPAKSQPRPRKKEAAPPKVDRTGWFA